MAAATAEIVRRVVHRQASRNPLRRMGIAGGDTSSLAARKLGIWALAFERVLTPGVTICRARSDDPRLRSEEHTSELQSLMRISYAVFCLKKKNTTRVTT